MARQEIASRGDRPGRTEKRLDDFARSLTVTPRYALTLPAAQSDAPVMVDLIATLEKQNPRANIWNLGYGRTGSSRQGRSAAKIPEIAD